MQQGIFGKGEVIDSPQGINMSNSGEMLKWVAVRGEIEDWAIYCHFAGHSFDWVRKYGDKVFVETDIRKLIPCTNEAFALYRY